MKTKFAFVEIPASAAVATAVIMYLSRKTSGRLQCGSGPPNRDCRTFASLCNNISGILYMCGAVVLHSSTLVPKSSI